MEGVQSHYFSVMNSVKQGSALSPILYSLFIDGLLMSLSYYDLGSYYGPFIWYIIISGWSSDLHC